jgi:hypothetical protein
MGNLPGQTMQGVGGQLRGEQERYLQDDMSRYYDSMGLPRQDLANYMATLQGNYGGTTSTTGSQDSGGGGLGGALGGGLVGLGMSGVAPGALGFAAAEGGMAGLGSLAMANPYMLPLMIGGGLLGSGIF